MMDLFWFRPEPTTTLKDALIALKITELRLSLAIKWITGFNYGDFPDDLLAELQNVNVGENYDPMPRLLVAVPTSTSCDPPLETPAKPKKKRRKFKRSSQTIFLQRRKKLKMQRAEAEAELKANQLAENSATASTNLKLKPLKKSPRRMVNGKLANPGPAAECSKINEGKDRKTKITPENQEARSPNNDSNVQMDTDETKTSLSDIKIVDVRTITAENTSENVKNKPISFSEHSCSYCFLTFESALALSVHDLIHAQLQPNPSPSPIRKKNRKQDLTKLRSELNTEQVCDAVQKNSSSPRQHLKKQMEIPYEGLLCQLCGLVAKTDRTLKIHMQFAHSTARPHQCPHCPLAFKIKRALQFHINRHFGKYIKPCPHCGVEKNAGDLYNHIKIVHRGQKFKCAQCPSMYTLRTHLKKHYREKHPHVTIPLDADIKVIYTKNPEDTTNPVRVYNKPRKVVLLSELETSTARHSGPGRVAAHSDRYLPIVPQTTTSRAAGYKPDSRTVAGNCE